MNAPRSSRGLFAVGVMVGQLLSMAGCIQPDRRADYRVLDATQQRSAGPAIAVRWKRDLAPRDSGSYVPVEQAAPGLDPIQGRVYVGSARGALFGLQGSRGRKLFQYDAKAGIEAQPIVDAARDELYVVNTRGTLLALRAEDAALRWQAETGGAVSQPVLLSEDAVYVVTDGDSVVALARSDGNILWRYHREPPEGFAIAGHAGLAETGGRLITGFGDGAVVALDASDGRVLWQIDTSLDLEEVDPARRFTDVDTTPAVAGNLVYAASFSGGLYGIDIGSGTMQLHQAELHGITGITAGPDALIVSSADQGVICLDLPALSVRWKQPIERGSPGKAEVRGDQVYVAESRGALLALSLADGRETGRLETAHGITAPASFGNGEGFVLSNAGTLFAFTHP